MPDGGDAGLARTGDLTPDEQKLLAAYRKLSKVQRERLLHVITGMPEIPVPMPSAGLSNERAAALRALAEVREKRMLALGLKRDPSQLLRPSPTMTIVVRDQKDV